MERTKWIVSGVCLLLAAAGLIVVIRLLTIRKISGGTLPYQIVDGFGRVVVTDIPAVRYDGRTYTWERMSADAQNELPGGYLPEGFTYAGDIRYIGTDQPVGDFQFTAVFDASGQLYISPDKPNTVCIRITTYWLKDSYVLFEAKE